jgi:hypothetical protein
MIGDAAQPVTNCCRDQRLGHALGALDPIQVAHDDSGDQGETNGDGGGQPVTAMVEPVAISVADRFDDLDGRQRPVVVDGVK